jgi:ABC-type bacteriocin/lantibiotic exporter with double-glycine peptidase domain
VASWRRRRELIATKLRETANTSAAEVEMFAALESLKGLGLEQVALERWTRTYAGEVGATLVLGRVDVVISSLRAALALASPLVLLGIGASQVLDGMLSVGMMLALNTLSLSLLYPVSGLFAAASQLQTVAAHLERIDDVLSRACERDVPAGAPADVRELRLDHVSFRHGSAGAPAIDDVSLVVPEGAAVALVGRSGAGKTTLARIIAGLYEPQTGEVYVGGIPRSRFGARAFRQQVGYVPQEARLFGPTLRDEFALARPAASSHEIAAVAEDVGIHREIMQMTLQYATPIVDGTVGLSSGQRQRIALARALIRRPALLVLDEATSALDAHAEATVHRCVSRLRCTRVIVAHRLSTIRNADLVVALERGRIVELGAPDDLAHAGGPYAALIAGQLEGTSEPSRRAEGASSCQ